MARNITENIFILESRLTNKLPIIDYSFANTFKRDPRLLSAQTAVFTKYL